MGSSTNVWILGGYQSDFSRNLTREEDSAFWGWAVIDGMPRVSWRLDSHQVF